MKAIVFDIDGVVIKSNLKKNRIIKDTIIKYGLYDLPGVKLILDSGLNRKVLLKNIYKIKAFDIDLVLNEINEKIAILESNPIKNHLVVDFINSNSGKYHFYKYLNALGVIESHFKFN